MENLFINDTITEKDIRFDIINTDNIFVNTLIPYNCKSDYPMHKIWIMIDNTKIIYKHNMSLYFYISSSNKAKNTITLCETIIIEKVKKYYEKLKLDKFDSNLINEEDIIKKIPLNIETTTSDTDESIDSEKRIQLNKAFDKFLKKNFRTNPTIQIKICNFIYFYFAFY